VRGAEMRARLVFLLVLLMLGALVGRVGYIQIRHGEELVARAQRAQFREIDVPAPRGRILDRHGRLLAASYHSCSIAADPQEVDDVFTFATRVAFLLGEPDAAPGFARRIETKRSLGKRFVYLRRRVDRELAQRVRASGLRGLDIREEPRREHPHGRAAAAVVGAVGADAHGRVKGLTGLERLFDDDLGGVPGVCPVFRSGRREIFLLHPEGARDPRPGRDLVTTIDVTLQQIVEDALDGLEDRNAPKTSCAVALDPRTGEILALAGRPAFDPCGFPDVSPESLRVPGGQCAYEPGSTLKPLVLAWALTRGAVRPGQVVDCGPGYRYFGRRRLRDVKANGPLPLQDVLVKSSNIGMAQVGRAVGIREMHGFLRALGFGRRTGAEVEGEQCGKVTPLPKWHEDYTLVSVSMGHELMVTPLQLAAAYATLLNGGRLLRPTLLRGAARPPAARIPYSREALAFVRRAMERVVAEGTGKRARVRGLRVGGKTGTSEKYPEGSGRYVSSFVGFAPADDPRLLVLVVADESQRTNGLKPYGGVVAAPVVGEILANARPLIERMALSESGVRHLSNEQVSSQGKVRVAAVHRSSVWAGEGVSPVVKSRNPDSESAVPCRRAGR